VLGAALALPVLGRLLPPIFVPLPIPQAQPRGLEMALPPVEPLEPRGAPIRMTRTTRTSQSAADVHPSQTVAVKKAEQPAPPAKDLAIAWPAPLFAAYLLVLAVLASRVCIGFILTWRMRRNATSVEDPGPLQAIRHYARNMQLRSVPNLLESSAVNVPLTLGVLQPAIVIPNGWRSWEEAKLTAVIAHELSHARRRDPLTRMLAAVYRSIFWWRQSAPVRNLLTTRRYL
jgi:beta-lactamase regulating signal transducer with metallopeptidase domain